MPQDQQTCIEAVVDALSHVISVMEGYPSNHIPDDELLQVKPYITIEDALRNSQTQSALWQLVDDLPSDFIPIFLGVSSLLGELLGQYNLPSQKSVGPAVAVVEGKENLELFLLLYAWNQFDTGSEVEMNLEMEGIDEALLDVATGGNEVWTRLILAEIERRLRLKKTPFAKTISTLLGPDALRWFAADSQSGEAKIQLHEMSRVNLKNLNFIQSQFEIEQELVHMGNIEEDMAKCIVTLCWVLTGLASYVDAGIFLSESDLHISSIRQGGMTMSHGHVTQTHVMFAPNSMLAVMRVLREALLDPLLTSCDLMWIANSLAQIHSVRTGHGEPVYPQQENFSVFLSHRGCDAKRVLADSLRTVKNDHGVFLDCLTLPQGMVNRRFVYESLTRAKKVLIVDSPNYSDSEWCLKEKWLADVMLALNMIDCEYLSLDDAVKIAQASAIQSTRPTMHSEQMVYPITPRILRDIDFWARTPNLHSLREKGISTDSFGSIKSFLNNLPEQLGPDVIDSAAQEIVKVLNAVVNVAPDADLEGLWETALQYVVAVLGLMSSARSKVDVRRGVDQMNKVVHHLVMSELHTSPAFKKNVVGYLALIAAAVTIDLSGFTLHANMEPAISRVIAGTGIVKNHLILLDVRDPGPFRDLHLNLLLLLVSHNIGSVGIVQLASDTVHELEVSGMSLAVLPCVTLHPGMEGMFSDFIISS